MTAAKLIYPQVALSELQFCAWVAQALPGDRLEYHRGFLACDITPLISRLGDNERKELMLLASRAFWTETNGLVHLVQKRLGPDLFSYIAIARRRTGEARAAATMLSAVAA